jgi:hypothetical protein
LVESAAISIEKCDVFVAIVSSSAIASTWVEHELHYAKRSAVPTIAFVLPGTDLSLPEARGFTFLLGNALLISPEVDLDSPQAVAPLVAAIYQVALASIAPDPIEAEDHIADKLQSSSGLTPVSESTLSNADPAVSNPFAKKALSTP